MGPSDISLRQHVVLKIASSPYHPSAEYNYQNPLWFFHFHVNIEFPESGKKIASINITNKISKGILVVVFSRCTRGPAIVATREYHYPISDTLRSRRSGLPRDRS